MIIDQRVFFLSFFNVTSSLLNALLLSSCQLLYSSSINLCRGPPDSEVIRLLNEAKGAKQMQVQWC